MINLLLLPYEILEQVFVLAQNPSLCLLSRKLYILSKSHSVRSRYILAQFGKNHVFDSHIGVYKRRPKLLNQAVVATLLDLGADPSVDCQYSFRHACSMGWSVVVLKMLSFLTISDSQNTQTVLKKSNLTADTKEKPQNPIYWRNFLLNNTDTISQDHPTTTNSFDQLIKNIISTKYTAFPLINIDSYNGAALVSAISNNQVNIIDILLSSHLYKNIVAYEITNDLLEYIWNFYSKSIKNTNNTFKIDFRHFSSLLGSKIPITYTVHKKLDPLFLGTEPLIKAVEVGNVEIVTKLINMGADPTANNSVALRSSVLCGDRRIYITELLLKSGADVHTLNDSCLLAACYRGDMYNAPISSNQNPISSYTRSFKNTQSLYTTRYSKNIPNKIKDTSEFTYIKTIELLLDYGADINTKDSLPLLYAVSGGHYNTCKILLNRGADIHAQNDIAIKEATKSGRQDIIALIKTHNK
ncbi:hypothetical protein BB558_004870 [Smittium angustum]|uniref:F-box domain-containing protein n=1 Tax=Smittium angustum TaxID=133377 RepID=A0A2U1J239_SMIAN|nr:hypothetical protein BB558_004870 [Smittium angustum]